MYHWTGTGIYKVRFVSTVCTARTEVVSCKEPNDVDTASSSTVIIIATAEPNAASLADRSRWIKMK